MAQLPLQDPPRALQTSPYTSVSVLGSGHLCLRLAMVGYMLPAGRTQPRAATLRRRLPPRQSEQGWSLFSHSYCASESTASVLVLSSHTPCRPLKIQPCLVLSQLSTRYRWPHLPFASGRTVVGSGSLLASACLQNEGPGPRGAEG